MDDAAKRVVLITGGSRGIGAAIAEAFARQGDHVVVSYRQRADAAAAVVGAIRDAGGSAVAVEADVSDAGDCDRLIKDIVAEHRRIDVLVNNAGVTRDGLVAVMKDSEWDEVIATNLSGVFRLCRAVCRPMMSARCGSIINVSSIAARASGRGQANYAASKGALEAFTRSLAAELGPRNVTVNAIAPGVIETEMTDFIREQAGDAIRERIALRRFGQPADVAGVATFLASNAARYITGAVIAVDGGLR